MCYLYLNFSTTIAKTTPNNQYIRILKSVQIWHSPLTYISCDGPTLAEYIYIYISSSSTNTISPYYQIYIYNFNMRAHPSWRKRERLLTQRRALPSSSSDACSVPTPRAWSIVPNHREDIYLYIYNKHILRLPTVPLDTVKPLRNRTSRKRKFEFL